MVGWGSALGAFLAFAVQEKTPQKWVRYGEDRCANCRMSIKDSRFAAVLLKQDEQKVLPFCSIECLATSLIKTPSTSGFQAFVSDYGHPGTFIEAPKAYFLQTKSIPSPMGFGLLAFRDPIEAKNAQGTMGGVLLDWKEVLSRVKDAWNP